MRQVPSLPRLSGNSRSCGFGGGLHSGQRAARLGHQPLAALVDRADAVEAGEAEDHLPAGMVRNAAADEAGIAALRAPAPRRPRRRGAPGPRPRRSCLGAGRPRPRRRYDARSRSRRMRGRPLRGATRSRPTMSAQRARKPSGRGWRRLRTWGWRPGSGNGSGDDRNRAHAAASAAVDTRRTAAIPEPSFEGRGSCSTTIWRGSSRPRSRTASG